MEEVVQDHPDLPVEVSDREEQIIPLDDQDLNLEDNPFVSEEILPPNAADIRLTNENIP